VLDAAETAGDVCGPWTPKIDECQPEEAGDWLGQLGRGDGKRDKCGRVDEGACLVPCE
jgi:hypothetical protein